MHVNYETNDCEKGFEKNLKRDKHLSPDMLCSNSLVLLIDMHVCSGAAAWEYDLWSGGSFISTHIFLVSLKQTFCY